MKIREDFVSNSSSSSYVISVNFKKYSFNTFIENVCEQCSTNDDDDKTPSENRAILEYCLKFFERVCLGEIAVGREVKTYKRGFDDDGKEITDSVELKYSSFEFYRKELGKNNILRYHDEILRRVDDNTIEHEFNKTLSSRVSVNRRYMDDILRNDWRYDKDGRGERVARIMRLLDSIQNQSDSWRTSYGAETYLITQNTLDNTRDMLAEGYSIEFEKWENIDALQARLDAGETVFAVAVGDGGEGRDDFRLFSDESRNPFQGIPCEIINNEY